MVNFLQQPELLCIKVKKVYDFCCQEESLFLCFEVEDVKPGDVVSDCELIVDECKAIKCTPLPNRPGFAEVTFRKKIRIEVTVNSSTKTSQQLTLEKTVILCVPSDPTDPSKCDPRMILQCEMSGVCENCVVTGEDVVCCSVLLCECFESKAKVKLKVLSYGFCEPRFCELVPPPPPPCPPPFPPQCVPLPFDP